MGLDLSFPVVADVFDLAGLLLVSSPKDIGIFHDGYGYEENAANHPKHDCTGIPTRSGGRSRHGIQYVDIAKKQSQ